ncbi:MAG: hypothetical protein ABWZ79_05870 [Pedobacter agri]
MGVLLGLFGITASILIGLKLIEASAIVLGLNDVCVLIGSIFYERLQSKMDKVEEENENLNRQLASFQVSSVVTVNNDTPSNLPDRFDTIYHH